jgi:hypothetical protein
MRGKWQGRKRKARGEWGDNFFSHSKLKKHMANLARI